MGEHDWKPDMIEVDDLMAAAVVLVGDACMALVAGVRAVLGPVSSLAGQLPGGAW